MNRHRDRPHPTLAFGHITEDDHNDMAVLLSDPNVMRYYRAPKPGGRPWPGSPGIGTSTSRKGSVRAGHGQPARPGPVTTRASTPPSTNGWRLSFGQLAIECDCVLGSFDRGFGGRTAGIFGGQCLVELDERPHAPLIGGEGCEMFIPRPAEGVGQYVGAHEGQAGPLA